MKMSKSLRQFLSDARRGDTYWVEKVKLQFALMLDDRRKAAGMTCKAMAEKIGSSAPYITKVLRGDENLTIESMVKLAHSTGGRLHVNIVDVAVEDAEWDVASLIATAAVPAGSNFRTAPGGTTTDGYVYSAANHHVFAEVA